MDTAPAVVDRPRPSQDGAAVRSADRSPSWVLGIAGLTVLARLPFLSRPLGSDEGGFLLIASQWSPGSSLYGDYWVDRPPLLMDFFLLAHHLGGTITLRVLGLGLVVASVLLAARIGRLAGGSPVATAATAAIFLVNPLLGTHEINGEIIATPFLLAAVALALQAADARHARTRNAFLAGAGAVSAAAVLVKQNELDGFVFLAIGALTFLGSRYQRERVVRRSAAYAGAGAGAVTAVVLLDAATRGTDPVSLWNAVITFRLDAAAVIHASAPSTTTSRLHGVLAALALSGAPLFLVPMLARLRRPAPLGVPDLRWATAAVIAWECVSVVGGGSYWLHYLICLVPGLVLSVATLSAAPGRWHGLRPALALALVSCLVTVGTFLVASQLTRPDPVITWLHLHTRPGDTAIVAFGHPDYLSADGLTSPYSELWSLPVRVRDPRLTAFTAVLESSARPDWIITGATGSIQGWGMDARAAQRVFDNRYRLVADLGSRRVYLDRSEQLVPTPSPAQTPGP